jgi:hypothetical protein
MGIVPSGRSRGQDGTGAVAVAPELALERMDFDLRAISPLRELGAYEALWDEPNATFKTLSEKFAARPDAVPSDFVPPVKAREYAEFVQRRFREADVTRFGVRVHGAGEYPEKLRDAAHPVELLYYRGWWDLVESRSVAVVGTRTPTPDAIARTPGIGDETSQGRPHGGVWTGCRHRYRGARNRDHGGRTDYRSDRHAAVAHLSERKREAAA